MARVNRRHFLKLASAGAGAIGASAFGMDLIRRPPWFSLGTALAADGPDVELTDNGTTVTLQNGLISATVRKSNAGITNLQLIGSTNGNESFNLVSGRGGAGFTTFNYYTGTDVHSNGLSGAVYRVIRQDPDLAEIAMSPDTDTSHPFAFSVDIHMALGRGMSGLYIYAIFGYPEEPPDGPLTVQQLRYAVAAGDPSFMNFVVDDQRGIEQRPTIAETQQWITLEDTTYWLVDKGQMYSKYQNISNLEGDNHAFMISNGKLGMSIIQTTKEWFAGGPTKQELTCHDYNDGMILLWHPFTSHYGSPDMAPPVGWEKIYGPFYLHVNEGSGTDPTANIEEMWADAKQTAAAELEKWPYQWITNPLYQVDSRSEVSGKLTIAGAGDVSPQGAWIVLSTPGEDWQYENLNYVHSARADVDGLFTVKAVRPGTYTLTAFVSGVFGELKQEPITVPASASVDVGNLVFKEASYGRLLWQIGTPDRSAGEFHIHGGADGFRKYLTWLEYPYEFPDGVDFKVGQDDIKEKWNFFHPCYRTPFAAISDTPPPGPPFQLQFRGTTEDLTLTTWTVRFDSITGYRMGVGTLEMALASSVFGTLRIMLNGTEIASMDPLPGPPGDNGSYRLADRSMYRQLPPIRFPASLIQEGENVMTLSPVRPPIAPLTRGNTVDNWMQWCGGVMYDVIRLWVQEGAGQAQ